MEAGSYTGNIRLSRGGHEYTEHIVDRLLLGYNGEGYAWIRQPDRDHGSRGKWSDMSLASPWSETALVRGGGNCGTHFAVRRDPPGLGHSEAKLLAISGDMGVKFHDNCGTHFIVPKDAVRSNPSVGDVKILARLEAMTKASMENGS
jgi:hypothetical protein